MINNDAKLSESGIIAGGVAVKENGISEMKS